MSQTKTVVIRLSKEEYSLLEELSDSGSAEEYIGRLVKQALNEQRMKNGYAEMAQTNLELAQMCFEADEQCTRQYEEELSKL